MHVNSKNFAISGLCRLKISASKRKSVELGIVIFAHKKGALYLKYSAPFALGGITTPGKY